MSTTDTPVYRLSTGTLPLLISIPHLGTGLPEEFATHLPAIPGPVTTHWIEGKRHALKNAETEIVEVVTGWLDALG